MSIEELVRAELCEVADSIEVPRMPSLDDDVETRRTRPGWRALVAAAVVALLLAGGAQLVLRDRDAAPDPSPRPDETPSVDLAPDRTRVPTEPSSGGRVVRRGDGELSVDGTTVPGRWTYVVAQRRAVWVAWLEGGAGQTSLWWGRGTTTHQIDQTTHSVAISPDARWLAWTMPLGGEEVALQVLDTRSAEVVASRPVPDHGETVGPVAVTDDGVVVFANCLRPTTDTGGFPGCAEARLDVWVPGNGVTATLPLPTARPDLLRRMLLPSGARNGLIVRPDRATPPQYLRLVPDGTVEVVATLPRRAVAVSADQQHVLVEGECAGPLCPWEVEPLGGGERELVRPPEGWSFLPSTAAPALSAGHDYVQYSGPLFVLPHTAEDDTYVVLYVVNVDSQGVRQARCDLSTRRCVVVGRAG